MRFASDSPEVTGIRFETITREEFNAVVRAGPRSDWQSKLSPISQVMPLDYEAYSAIILPWTALRGGARYEPTGVADAYRFFDLPVPDPLTLDRLYADFQVIEKDCAIPAPASAILGRFAAGAESIFIKSQSYGSNDANYLTLELDLFLALGNPFEEMPDFGLYAMFPRGGVWYIHYPSDTPVLYLAGSADLIESLARVLHMIVYCHLH